MAILHDAFDGLCLIGIGVALIVFSQASRHDLGRTFVVAAMEANRTCNFGSQPWPSNEVAVSFGIDPSPSTQVRLLNREWDQAMTFAKQPLGKRSAAEVHYLCSDPGRKFDAELMKGDDPQVAVPGYTDRRLEGWAIRVSDRLMKEEKAKTEAAIDLLRQQLATVVAQLPGAIVERLRDVPIWMSPEYKGVRPTAEYHPDSNWLQKAGRRAELVKCIELTNISIFPQECRRMPMLIMHELAHAYHDQVLGFDDERVKIAFERAKASGTYESVQRNQGKFERAYALANHKEYFAETSEAFLGENDFYPTNRTELTKHDPAMFTLLQEIWAVGNQVKAENSASQYRVTKLPESMNLDPFYGKYLETHGYPIVSSSKVSDYALKEAAYLVDMMLAERPDIRKAMIASGSRLIVMAHDEYTTDVPEHSHLKPKLYMDARARGLGGSKTDPVCSCAEENLLGFDGDPYASENILIHEFAHNIHLRGLVNMDPTFDDRLQETFERAMSLGLWKGKYASTNHAEYFAEGVQSWFNNNRQPDHDHNHVDTREELKEYDPGLAAICESIFGKTRLIYTKPATRLTGHLAGYDPAQSPTFRWPQRLTDVKKQILQEARNRDASAQQEYKN